MSPERLTQGELIEQVVHDMLGTVIVKECTC